MDAARYFVPDHPTLTEVYTRDELRVFLQRGELSRSDMICDDETGMAHLLGDFLSMPYREATVAPSRSTRPSVSTTPAPDTVEFRGDVPLKSNIKRPAPLDQPPAPGGGSYRPGQDFPVADDDDEFAAPEPDEYLEEEDHLRPFYNPFDQTDRAAFEDDAPVMREDGAPQEFTGDAEELLYLGHPSWLAFPKALAGFLLFAAAAGFAWQAGWGLEWLLLLGSVSGLFLVYITLERTTTSYYVTPFRVEIEYGLIGRNTKEVRIRDIRAIDVQQKGYTALVGVGTVHFDSSASSGPEVIFKNVSRPHQIKELVRGLQHYR